MVGAVVSNTKELNGSLLDLSPRFPHLRKEFAMQGSF